MTTDNSPKSIEYKIWYIFAIANLRNFKISFKSSVNIHHQIII